MTDGTGDRGALAGDRGARRDQDGVLVAALAAAGEHASNPRLGEPQASRYGDRAVAARLERAHAVAGRTGSRTLFSTSAGTTQAAGPTSAAAEAAPTQFTPDDPYLPQQTYYGNLGDIKTIWSQYNGAGVHVGVYDTGVDFTNPDLAARQDATRDVVINGQAQSGAPDDASSVTPNHGTLVAGVIAATGNNGIGVTGAAWGASLTSVNIFDSTSSDYINSSDPQYFYNAVDQMNRFDVTNNSYGDTPSFDINEYDNFSSVFNAHLAGVEATGRGGLGTVIVQAAGNNGVDANGDGVAASRYTVNVGGINQDGTLGTVAGGYTSNFGDSVLVMAVGTGVVTTDRSGSAGVNAGGAGSGFDGTGNYAGPVNGTSFAAPQVTGIVALMLQANPGLGWRDVQNILAESASYTDHAASTYGQYWTVNNATNFNGGGDHINYYYGYGVVNAYNAVRMAEAAQYYAPTAQTSANEQSLATPTATPGTSLTPGGTTTYAFQVAGNIDVEHVDLTLGITSSNFNDLTIYLTSPSGTRTQVYNGSIEVASNGGSYNPNGVAWTYGLDNLRGELSAGTWTVSVVDAGADTGTLSSAQMTVYGSSPTSAQVYHYTDEFHTMAAQDASRVTLNASGTGSWIDASALHSASTIDLATGSATIDGTALTIVGNAVTSAIGGDGDDTLTAGAAGGELVGMRGDDTLVGGPGADTLVGGQGADRFVETAQPTSVVDTIADYDQGDSGSFSSAEGDVIDVSALVQGDSLVRIDTNPAGTGPFTLQVDANGSWTSVATLSGLGLNDGVTIMLGPNATDTAAFHIAAGSADDLTSALASVGAVTATGLRYTIETVAGGLSSAQAFNLAAGDTVTLTVDTGTTTLAGPVSGSGGLTVSGAGTLALSSANTLSGTITLAGTLQLRAAGAAGTGTIAFAGSGAAPATLMLDKAAQPGDQGTFGNTLSSFGAGDALDLKELSYSAALGNGAVYDPVTGLLSVTEGSVTESFKLTNVAAGTLFFAHDDQAGGTRIDTVPLCFAQGTAIRTTRGDVAVEALRPGDRAVTVSGASRTIRWLGHRAMRAAAHRAGSGIWPVRVLAGAFGSDLPRQDLFLSPGHPVLVGAGERGEGGHLVPIMCLVNGTTIERVEIDAVTYWHVELDAHDILLAEGLPAESYLEWGDRAFFDEGAADAFADPDVVVPGLAGRCRPVAVGGPVVAAERRRLDAVFAGRLVAACGWPDEDAPAELGRPAIAGSLPKVPVAVGGGIDPAYA